MNSQFFADDRELFALARAGFAMVRTGSQYYPSDSQKFRWVRDFPQLFAAGRERSQKFAADSQVLPLVRKNCGVFAVVRSTWFCEQFAGKKAHCL